MTNTSTRFRPVVILGIAGEPVRSDFIGVIDSKLHQVAYFSPHSDDDDLSDVIAAMEEGDLGWAWSDVADVDYKEMS